MKSMSAIKFIDEVLTPLEKISYTDSHPLREVLPRDNYLPPLIAQFVPFHRRNCCPSPIRLR